MKSDNLEEISKKCEQLNITILNSDDKDYPQLLKEIPDHPKILYAKGKVSLLNKQNSLAIVGTRNARPYGKNIAYQFAAELAQYGITIISGLAAGIDTSAHQGALSTGETVAVLGCGLDICYPAENRQLYTKIAKEGLLLTEFPPGTKPLAHNFPMRNRIIAGISRGTLVVESKQKGGSLITANLALEYNREVFAIPGDIHSETSIGTNSLIQMGAKLTQSVKDILEEFNWLIPNKNLKSETKYNLKEDEKLVFNAISLEPIHIDTLQEKTNLAPNKLISILTFLEIQDIARQLPGKMFVKK